MNMSDEGRRPSWRRFRQVYREERGKVRAERARNRHTYWLGFIAALGLFLGFTGPFINSVFGEDIYGRSLELDLINPAFIVGVVAGLLWLVVKAITGQNQPPAD